MKRNKYSKDFEKEMYSMANRYSFDIMYRVATEKYKYDIDRESFRKYLSKRKIRYTNFNTKLSKTPVTAVPIFSERKKADGMTQIKVSEHKWMYKQRYIYEQYHNVKLKSTDYVIFLDGDRNNFDIDNLMCVDCRVSSIYANMRLTYTTPEITKLAILVAENSILVKNILKLKPTNHKNGLYSK